MMKVRCKFCCKTEHTKVTLRYKEHTCEDCQERFYATKRLKRAKELADIEANMYKNEDK